MGCSLRRPDLAFMLDRVPRASLRAESLVGFLWETRMAFK
jgi:hypothetical protein